MSTFLETGDMPDQPGFSGRIIAGSRPTNSANSRRMSQTWSESPVLPLSSRVKPSMDTAASSKPIVEAFLSVDWGYEMRAFFRDPDGQLLEISETREAPERGG